MRVVRKSDKWQEKASQTIVNSLEDDLLPMMRKLMMWTWAISKRPWNLKFSLCTLNKIWKLVNLPKWVKFTRHTWFYKRKRLLDGKVETFKTRLVPKCYTHKKGIDFEETFSLVAMIKFIHIFLSIIVDFDYKIWQIDVKITFLNENIDKRIYVV